MTQTSLSETQVKFLGRTIKHCEEGVKNRKGTFMRYAIRSEAALLLLHMNGYRYDYEKWLPYKEEGKVTRNYVS